MVAEIEQLATPRATKVAPSSAPISLDAVTRLLAGLNREQRRAVTHGEGPQLVIAGPGTGKTEVVTRRVAWLIATKRAKPREILALTFTDNAAEEMQARVDLLVPYGQADAAIHTFHAFGDRLLREYAFELGLPGDVRLITRAEGIVLLREHLFDLGLERYRPLGDPTRFLGALVDLFQRGKEACIGPEEALARARLAAATANGDQAAIHAGDARLELATAYARYQALLTQRGLIDHGDQVWLALRLLRERDDVRDAVSGCYRYVLVDEFQDLNAAQLETAFALSGSSRNVTVVGDPDQAIYTFRGAAGDGVSRFMAEYEDARRVILRRNYRSCAPIVEAGRRLIAHAADSGDETRAQRHIAHRRSRDTLPVRRLAYASMDEEADGVANQIARRLEEGKRPRDFAVLARSNHELDMLVRSLTVRGVPIRTQLPADFFAQAHVRPLLAFLRVVADPEGTTELYVLATAKPYSLGGAPLTDLLGQARRRHRSLWGVLRDLVNDPSAATPASFRARAAKLVEHVDDAIELSHGKSSVEVLYDHLRRSGRLARLVKDGQSDEANSVARFFAIVRARASLLAQDRVPLLVPHIDGLIEAYEEQADSGPLDLDAVSVLTVHRAKGLEFPIVFVTGLSDGRFPARGRPQVLPEPWSSPTEGEDAVADRLEEERRLCYVAMTRARDELWLTHHLHGPGGRGRRRPSPFLAEALDVPATSLEPEPEVAAARLAALSEPRQSEALDVSPQHGPTTTFSFSALEEYIDCPERYRIRYVVGLPTPPHHALAYGSAIHHAVAAFHLSRAQGKPLSETQLLAAFRDGWSAEGFLSREHEEARFAAGEAALLRFRSQQLAGPDEVVAVERPFVFAMDELRIRGRMDRVDSTPDGAAIVDYKSSDVRDQQKADERARDSLQLQVYGLAHQEQSGELPYEVRLHFLDSGITGRARPSVDRQQKARQKLRAAADGIRSGKFVPRPNPVTCGYCPFRQICPSSAA